MPGGGRCGGGDVDFAGAGGGLKEIFTKKKAAPQEEETGLLVLRFIEKPNTHGPSKNAAPEDVVQFAKIAKYDPMPIAGAVSRFQAVKANLQEGDLIAYRMTQKEAGAKVRKGGLNAIGYQLLKYGHLGIVVKDPNYQNQLRMFSAESFVGTNTKEGIDTLAEHEWDVYRLDQWKRIDMDRMHEFVRLVEKKAGRWYGYDFSGMFGLWNSNLRPKDEKTIGHDYICSTAVEAALYYAGVELDAVRNKGYLDVCTPLQVVSSKGHIMKRPDVKLAVETADMLTSASAPVMLTPLLAVGPEAMVVANTDVATTKTTATLLAERAKYPAVWFAPADKATAKSWEILPQEAKPGEVILSKRNELGILSNFTKAPFELHGKHYESVEGLWQMMHYPENDLDERAVKAKAAGLKYPHTREEVSQMIAFEASGAGRAAGDINKQLKIDWVTFEGEKMPYKSAKPGVHYKIILEAMWAKVRQNPEVKRVLLSTGDLVLKPDHHQSADSPPEWRYFEIWMQIRDELRQETAQTAQVQ